MKAATALPGLLVLGLALAGCAQQHPTAELPPATPLPEQAEDWFDLGTRLLAAGEPAQAEDAFIRSLRVEGMTAAALTGAGVAAQRQGLLTEAKRYFERAKELEPTSIAAHNNLGAALFGLGELQAARHAFRIAFALSSGASQQAAQNLEMTELAIARAEAAAAITEQPVALHTQNVQRSGSTTYKLIGMPGTAGNG